MASSFLVAPCVLALAKPVAQSQMSIQWRQQAACVALGWILLLPLGTAIHWGTGFVNTVKPISADYALFIHTTMLGSVILFFLQTWQAVASCAALLKQRVSQNRGLLSELQEPRLNTLRVLLITVVANATICAAKVLYCALLDGTYISLNLTITAAQLAMVVHLASAIINQVLNVNTPAEQVRAEVFSHPQKLPASSTEQVGIAEPPKYANSSLTPAREQAILRQIRHAMDVEQLYTQPGLGLRDLCEHLQETPHNLSQVINNSHLQNFYDMVNRRRVALAKQLLTAQPSTSILDTAFACGFNSKSAFNGAFKRYTGQTPSQFRADARPKGGICTSNAFGLDDVN